MGPVTLVAMYVTIWWLVLFAVLPFGTRPVAEADSATGWRGVPEQPRIWAKVVATTLISAAIWVVIYLVMSSGWIDFRTGWLALPDN